MWKKSTDIEINSHSELDEQMKKLERTLKYYIQSRQNEQHAKTKLSGINPHKTDMKIERRLSKVIYFAYRFSGWNFVQNSVMVFSSVLKFRDIFHPTLLDIFFFEALIEEPDQTGDRGKKSVLTVFSEVMKFFKVWYVFYVPRLTLTKLEN